MRKKTKKTIALAVGITLALVAVALLGNFLLSVSDIEVSKISIIENDDNFLDFCTIKSQCLLVLNNNGMPDNYLEKKGLEIDCQGGKCYVIEK